MENGNVCNPRHDRPARGRKAARAPSPGFASPAGTPIAGYFVRRTAIATLRELDDRALRDIGLARSQIEAAVHGFVPLPDQGRMS